MQSVEPVLENAIKTLQKVVDVRGMGKKWVPSDWSTNQLWLNLSLSQTQGILMKSAKTSRGSCLFQVTLEFAEDLNLITEDLLICI